MKLMLEFSKFNDSTWKKEIESSALNACDDFITEYELEALFEWGFWLINLNGYQGDHDLYAEIKKKVPERCIPEEKCLKITFVNKYRHSSPDENNYEIFDEDDNPPDFDEDYFEDEIIEERFLSNLEINQDENTGEEFDRMMEILEQELSLDMKIIEIRRPKEILKTHFQITIYIIYEKK